MSVNNVQVMFASPMRRFLFAVISGGFAFVLLYYYIEKTLVESSGGERIPVLISTKAVRPGERVDGQGIAMQTIPSAYVHDNSVREKDRGKVLGRRVYRQIAANQPLLWSDFDAPESERSSGASLSKGMRAMAMPIGESMRKAQLIRAGDAVDIIFHFTVPQGSVAVTLFQRVIVIEQTGDVAVLSLTPEQAEQLAFAQAHGGATITLRNREDTEQKELKQVSFPNLLSGYVDVRPGANVTQATSGTKNDIQLQLLEQLRQHQR